MDEYQLRISALLLSYVVASSMCAINDTEACHSGLKHQRLFTVRRDTRLVNHTIVEITQMSSRLRCVTRCIANSRCHSINYMKTSQACHLNDVTIAIHPDHVVEDADYDHFVMSNVFSCNKDATLATRLSKCSKSSTEHLTIELTTSDAMTSGHSSTGDLAKQLTSSNAMTLATTSTKAMTAQLATLNMITQYQTTTQHMNTQFATSDAMTPGKTLTQLLNEKMTTSNSIVPDLTTTQHMTPEFATSDVMTLTQLTISNSMTQRKTNAQHLTTQVTISNPMISSKITEPPLITQLTTLNAISQDQTSAKLTTTLYELPSDQTTAHPLTTQSTTSDAMTEHHTVTQPLTAQMITSDTTTSQQTPTDRLSTRLTSTNPSDFISAQPVTTRLTPSESMSSQAKSTNQISSTRLITQTSPIPGTTTDALVTTVPTSPTIPFYRSCEDWKNDGYTEDGLYEIDPDGPNIGVEPFTITCAMATGATIVHHNKETTQEVSGYESPGSYVLDITYDVSLPQIIALTEISAHCKQRIKLRCWKAAMWYGGELHSWWVSRDDQKMENWGTPTGTSGCPCGQLGECGLYKCDCDWNLIQWNTDEGDLTDKSTLPVKQLRLGETGGLGEKVQYTVWPLQCYG